MSAEQPQRRPRPEPPPPWTQECPRSLRLEPGGLHVPSGTLRALLKSRARLSLRYAGFGFEPAVCHDDVVSVAAAAPEPGAIAVCDWDGWPDLLRLNRAGGAWNGMIDALPERRRPLEGSAIIGIVTPAGRSGPAPTTPDRLRIAMRWSTVRWFWRRVERAPRFGGAADRSVREKYDRQAADYARMRSSNLTDEQIGELGRHVRPPGSILVAGAGAGGEVIHLVRLGYRVAGFDVLPSMVSAARRALDEAGLQAEIVQASLDEVDLGDRRFGAIYFTPLLYSFLAGRRRRVAMLRRVSGLLEADGALMLSAARTRGAARAAQIGLAWVHRRFQGDHSVELGDWYTMYLTSAGTIDTSFLHVFRPGQVEGELRAAGFRSIRRLGGHLVATLRR